MTRDEKINVIRRLKAGGATDQAIAEKLSLSESAVLRLRQKGGIAGLPSAGRRGREDKRKRGQEEGKKGRREDRKKGGREDDLYIRQINLIKATHLRVMDRILNQES